MLDTKKKENVLNVDANIKEKMYVVKNVGRRVELECDSIEWGEEYENNDLSLVSLYYDYFSNSIHALYYYLATW